MQQTERYQLNQWEQTDRILMEDFNNDNAKIEAALIQLRSEMLGADLVLAKFNSIDSKISALETRVTALEKK